MNTLVDTKYGKVNGFKENGLIKWLGVPYAKPPIGKLSFKRAEPADTWEGVKQCNKFQNKPIQYSLPFEKVAVGGLSFSSQPKQTSDEPYKKIPESKDCLYLNIWRKDGEEKKLPVMVWIYGGAYLMGEGSYPTYDGCHFAEDGILMITINYRLGLYGMYDFSSYNKTLFDSNCALSDQIMALKWIKENISQFGGDPDNITVAGESAGGNSVTNLLAAPSAKNLFQKAIIESGAPSVLPKKMVKIYTDLFLKHLGLTADHVDKLVDMDGEKTKEAVTASQKEFYKTYPGVEIAGMEIDDLLPEDSLTAISKGSAADKKVLIGTNKDEASLFYKLGIMPDTWKKIEAIYATGGYKENLEIVNALYGKEDSEEKAVQKWLTDRYFLINSIKLAKEQSQYNDVWMYQFDAISGIMKKLGINAMHSAEMPFVFGTIDAKTHESMLWTGAPKSLMTKLTNEIHTYWTWFIKSGNPNKAQQESWTKYKKELDNIMIFDEHSRMENRDYKEELIFWKDTRLKNLN